MRGTHLLLAIVATLVVEGPFVGRCLLGQLPSTATPQPIPFYGQGYVLLQHGNVLQGFVKPHADRLTIVLDKGNEVTLPNRQVLTVAKTKEALYAYQVRSIRKWGTGEHWHLAHWCIQNGLIDQAIEHYTELEKTVADSPKFKQLDLQLREALLADEKVQQALAEQGIPNPMAPVPELDANASFLVTASHSTEEPARLASALHRKELDQAPRILPGYMRRSFQTEILPIVVSRCGQSGCHGMLSKNDFQVFQPVGDQAASITQKNLDTIMRYIDADEPLNTSLVQYATRPHGNQRNASLHPNRDEERVLLEKILKWIQSLSASSLDPSSVTTHALSGASPAAASDVSNRVQSAVALVPKNLVQNSGQRGFPSDSFPVQDRNAKLSKPARSGAPAVVLDASELRDIEDAIKKLEGIEKGGSAARDPFDPAVFNAKYSNAGGSSPKN